MSSRQHSHMCSNKRHTKTEITWCFLIIIRSLSFCLLFAPFSHSQNPFSLLLQRYSVVCVTSPMVTYTISTYSISIRFFVSLFVRSLRVCEKANKHETPNGAKNNNKAKEMNRKSEEGKKRRDPVTGKNETRKISVSYYRWATTIITYYSRDARSQ